MAAKFKNPYLQVTDQLTGGSEPKNPYLQHGWGNSAKAKQKEKEYNHDYYLRNKEKWEKYRDDLSSYRTNLTKSNADLATKRDNYERQLSDIAERKRQLTVGGKSNTKEYSDLVGRERIVKKSLAGVRQQQANASKAQSEMDKHAANIEKQYSRAKVDESNARRRELANPSKGSFSDSIKRFGQSVNESLQKHNDNWQRGMDMILNKNVTSQTTPASTMQKKKVNPYNSHANDEKARQQQAKRKYDNYTLSQTHPSTPSPSDIAKAKKNAERNTAYAENMKNAGHAISPSQYEAERRKDTVSGRRAAANAANEADKQRRGREHYWRDYETPRRKKEATEQYLRARAHEGSGALKFLDDEDGYQNYLKNERAQNKEKQQEYESVSKEIALATRKQKQIQDKIDKNNEELAKLLYPSATGNNSVSQKDSISANKSRIDIIKKQLENDKKAYANMTKQINSLNETLNRYRSE